MWTHSPDGGNLPLRKGALGLPPSPNAAGVRRAAPRRGCALARPAKPGQAPQCNAMFCCGCPRLVDWL